MYSLRLFSWALFAVAGLCLLAALTTGDLIFVPASMTGLATGLLFLAADKALLTLAEIRDAVGGNSQTFEQPTEHIDADAKPTRSVEEITADLKAMKERVGG